MHINYNTFAVMLHYKYIFYIMDFFRDPLISFVYSMNNNFPSGWTDRQQHFRVHSSSGPRRDERRAGHPSPLPPPDQTPAPVLPQHWWEPFLLPTLVRTILTTNIGKNHYNTNIGKNHCNTNIGKNLCNTNIGKNHSYYPNIGKNHSYYQHW